MSGSEILQAAPVGTKLYAAPVAQPQAVPLTDEQIRDIGNSLPPEHRFHGKAFARAIEAAHGIAAAPTPPQPPVQAVPEGWRPVPKAALVDLLNLIDPPPIELAGKVHVFVNPDAAEILRRISAIVRAMLAAAPTPGEKPRKPCALCWGEARIGSVCDACNHSMGAAATPTPGGA
jgi:hypothetical protein